MEAEMRARLNEAFVDVADGPSGQVLLVIAAAVATFWPWLGESHNVAALFVLPFIWAGMWPWVSGPTVLIYFLVGVWPVQPAVVTFFPGWHPALSVLAWFGLATLLALPWWALNEVVRRGVPKLAVLGTTVVVAATIVPPFGTLAWCHPLMSAGWLFPGGGLLSVTLVVAAWMAGIGLITWKPYWALPGVVVASALAILLTFASSSWEPDQQSMDMASKVVTVHTQEHVPATIEEVVMQVQKIRAWIDSAQLPAGTIAAFPETTLANWNAATSYIVDERLLRLSHRNPVLMGTTWIDRGIQYNGAVLLLDGRRYMLRARQPLFLGMWRPWAEDHHAAAWDEELVLTIKGTTIALRVCAEEFSGFWSLWDRVRHPEPFVHLGIGNSWWATSPVQERSHERHAIAWARLVGAPVKRAINHGVALPPSGSVNLKPSSRRAF